MGRGDLPKISELGESGIGPGLWAPYGAWSISPHCLPWASPLGAASRTPAVGFLPEHPGHFLITLTIKCLVCLFMCLSSVSPPRMDIPDLASSLFNPWGSQVQGGHW